MIWGNSVLVGISDTDHVSKSAGWILGGRQSVGSKESGNMEKEN